MITEEDFYVLRIKFPILRAPLRLGIENVIHRRRILQLDPARTYTGSSKRELIQEMRHWSSRPAPSAPAFPDPDIPFFDLVRARCIQGRMIHDRMIPAFLSDVAAVLTGRLSERDDVWGPDQLLTVVQKYP